MYDQKNEPPFRFYKITFRNPKSFHLFHKDEGITKKMVEDILKSSSLIKEDPRKLRKKIKLFHVTEHLTKRIRITIIFQIFPWEKRLHVINAFLGSFHHKNLYEKMGLKAGIKEERKLLLKKER